jgi:hypothetical protein
VRLTRHAKNQLRWIGLTGVEVEWVVAHPISEDRDRQGRPRYLGEVEGKRVRVVIAFDDPDLVVTVHPRRRR